MKKEEILLKNENWLIDRMIEVDGTQSQLRVDLAFNNLNGQFKITTAVTTKQVSRNPEVRAAICSQLATMIGEAMIKGVELRDEWFENNGDGDDDQPELFERQAQKSEKVEDLSNEDFFENGLPDSQSDDEPEEEDDQPMKKLSFEAPVKNKGGRPRKEVPASNVKPVDID